MDNIPMLLTGSVAGYLLATYVCHDKLKQVAAKTASKAIDTYVDLKYFCQDLVFSGETVSSGVSSKVPLVEWLMITEDYKMYRLQDNVYITFNMSHEPGLHYEDSAIDNITVITKEGSKVEASDYLKDVLVKCGGHGCTFNSGVPSIKQLKLLPSHDELLQELDKIKKIIINTTSYDEHVLQ